MEAQRSIVPEDVHRLAMWSGPRNISTAMMRAWGNRIDTFVCDEPLYAYYLTQREIDHPGTAEVIEHHETDWSKITEWLTGPIPEGKTVFYQKQMSHHLLPGVDRGWLSKVTNCFLIRDPREMLTSLAKRMPRPSLEDTGLPQQLEIFELVRDRTGCVPPVIDSRDVLENPRGLLSKLCEVLSLPFSERMLEWPEGRRRTDGVWAKHWYDAVERSTGFGPYRPKSEPLPAELEQVHEQCVKIYDSLWPHRLQS